MDLLTAAVYLVMQFDCRLVGLTGSDIINQDDDKNGVYDGTYIKTWTLFFSVQADVYFLLSYYALFGRQIRWLHCDLLPRTRLALTNKYRIIGILYEHIVTYAYDAHTIPSITSLDQSKRTQTTCVGDFEINNTIAHGFREDSKSGFVGEKKIVCPDCFILFQ